MAAEQCELTERINHAGRSGSPDGPSCNQKELNVDSFHNSRIWGLSTAVHLRELNLKKQTLPWNPESFEPLPDPREFAPQITFLLHLSFGRVPQPQVLLLHAPSLLVQVTEGLVRSRGPLL